MKWRLAPAVIALGLTVALGAGVAHAEGDAAKGKKVFNKCKACHTLKAGKHRVGPSLAGVIGRGAGMAEGFKKYSKPLKESGLTWDDETLMTFLTNPKKMIPGTKMIIKVKKEKDRENLIAYLKQEAM